MGSGRRFRLRPGVRRGAVRHRDPAAERDGQPAYGARAQQHDPGHPDPLSPNARARRACGSRVPTMPASRRRWSSNASSRSRASSSTAAWGRARRTRKLIGRDEFIERVWDWREESGGIILQQLRRLGASCDWSRERFTMDEGLSRAVLTVFVALYKERADLQGQAPGQLGPEVPHRDLRPRGRAARGQGQPLALQVPDRGRGGACTHHRRDDAAGDDAGRHGGRGSSRGRCATSDLIGRHAILPIVGRRIPIIVADEHADPEQGSGAVKITPAHDFNDFEVGRRHDLEMINIFDRDARLNENVPEAYRGLDRFDARKKVVEEMESLDLLERIEDHDARRAARRPVRACRSSPG